MANTDSRARLDTTGPRDLPVLGDGGTAPPIGTVKFPWPVFDGTVPDVPLATAPGKTWYCDPVNGNDAWDGSSFTFVSGSKGPKKSLTAALASSGLKPGDTILLGGGVYREYPTFEVSGTPTAPITIGSYGRGTGAPILDGGIKPGTWTPYTAKGQTTVWQTSTKGTKLSSTTPVLGIYVNSGGRETALREVPHGQLMRYASEALPPNMTQADLKNDSNNWYFDAAGATLYADFGGTLGAGDPNAADISLLFNAHESLLIITDVSDYNVVGLTMRAASWDAVWATASRLWFDQCDVKFNGGGGVIFDIDSRPASGNRVTRSRLWMNVLENWPRFNNENVGGGWPAALSWYDQSDALGEGNLIYGNGGEGLILWGTGGTGTTATVHTNNVIRHNVIFDNFSVNLYMDNTQGALLDGNFVFNHPKDPSLTFDQLFALSPGYEEDFGRRLQAINLSLADEPGSAFDDRAHLSDITVVNNILAGGRMGILDYDDGTKDELHGLRNCVIANNTIIVGTPQASGDSDTAGWQHMFPDTTKENSSNSIVKNNIIATTSAETAFAHMPRGTFAGIDVDYNLYSGPAAWRVTGNPQTFPEWKKAHPNWDVNSQNTDAKLGDLSEFTLPASVKPIYDWSKARPAMGSPASGGGVELTGVTTDFAGAARTSAKGQGALPPT